MSKPKDEKEIQKAAKSLAKICEKFLKKIIDSYSALPPYGLDASLTVRAGRLTPRSSIRQLCLMMHEEVEKHFPGKSNIAIAGLMFLRYICPAIVTPDHTVSPAAL
jgi:hypothetical protein